MSLDRHVYYVASCDIRLDVARQPMEPQPSTDDWRAWSAAGAPKAGPERDAIGHHCCPAEPARVLADSATEAKRKLMGAGWKIVPGGRGRPPQSFCPQHRELI